MPTRVWFTLLAMALLCTGLPAPEMPLRAKEGHEETPWVFTPPRRPVLPDVKNKSWVANPIDAFVLAKLEASELSPSSPADKLTLLRRVTYDLTGLPPTIEEQQEFVSDASTEAYEKVVDRLLASPRYGERWAQHWLDLVRYAETDGFKADDHRPYAYLYRDYVVRAFNEDLPYDRFIRQQLAGDELEPGNPQALLATGFNRLWPDEYNAANLEQRRQEILDDVTEVTGLVFLGLTMGCARCHDHKFDPILQSDYFRLQAFFAPMLPRDDTVAADAHERERHREQLAGWEEATREIRHKMESLVASKREEQRKFAMGKFRPEIQEAVLATPEKRTPYQQQIAAMAEQQLQRAEREAPTKMTGEMKKKYQEMEKELAAMEPKRPQPLPAMMTISDVGRTSPPTHLLANGNWRKPADELEPGFPVVLGHAKPDTRIDSSLSSTGRRAALARWLTQKNHPLTARVMVNRLWQHHFGRGIVGTPNDFGVQGDPPTHPELLDWLAVEFMNPGEPRASAPGGSGAWSLKRMHRLMVMSATYRQSSLVNPKEARHVKGLEVDPENRLLWHASRRRLEGEAIRDAMLSLSGELSLRMYGPSARPKLPEGISKYAWKPDAKPEDQHRRSIYVLAKRNMRYPLFDAFDLPDMHNSCARRTTTTTAPQALMLLNSEITLERAQTWAASLQRQFASDERKLVAYAFQEAWGRTPTEEETKLGLEFIEKQKNLTDFCHAILNSNEFLYVD